MKKTTKEISGKGEEKKRILLWMPPELGARLEEHLWRNRIRNRTAFILKAIEDALKAKK